MTNLPPPDPQSSQREPLGFDDFIGIFVAFITIGGILFWSFSQRNQGFISFLSPSPSPSAQPIAPTPGATANPAPVTPTSEPTVAPTQSPLLTPVSPFPASNQPGLRGVVPIPVPAPAKTPAPATTLAPAPALGKPINFVDVPQDFWARPFIDALSARGIVNGYTGNYFRPDQLVTRAEFAAIVQAAFDKNNPGRRVSEFRDIPSNFWAAPAIDKATSDGFLKGYPGNFFQPTQEIPSAQVLVALANGLNLQTPSDPAKILQIYQDAAQIPNYATEKIAAATQARLVVNYPNLNLLNPNQNATRAQVAAIVYQAMVQAGKVQPIQSQYIVQPPQ